MKASGAPETGDLVVITESFAELLDCSMAEDKVPGIIIECQGIRCRVQWPGHYRWVPRTNLTVVSNARN